MSIHGWINLGGNTLREKLHEPCACGIQIGALRSVNNSATATAPPPVNRWPPWCRHLTVLRFKSRWGTGSPGHPPPFPLLPGRHKLPGPPAQGRRRPAPPLPCFPVGRKERRALLPRSPSPLFYLVKSPPFYAILAK